jgi:hypothetical protein
MRTQLFFSVMALSVSLVTGSALAATLKVGGDYANGLSIKIDGNVRNTGGGNFLTSYLDDKKLDYMYCIDILHSINPSSTYNTIVSKNAQLAGRSEITVANAGKIAWLVSTQAKTAVTKDQQAGLQAAIWKQVYGNRFELLTKTTAKNIQAAYSNYITALGSNTAPLNSVLWLDPRGGASGTKNAATHYQDQVAWGNGFGLVTPIPAALWLFGSAGVGLMSFKRRKNVATLTA